MANETSIQVQVRIRRETKYGELNDAIYFTADELFDKNGKQSLSQKAIETAIANRVANYERVMDEIQQRAPDPPPTDDEEFGVLSEEYVTRLMQWAKRNGKGGV